jgi:GT2 family glycosyltransferase
MHPSVSVIIPVYNAGSDLELCLRAIASSRVPPLEIIVVDDGSTDNSVAVGRSAGAHVITTGARRGPAVARNLGASAAQADVLLFLDADVTVHADTISELVAAFHKRPELAAVIGAYDKSPTAMNFMSQYRNLMHCFVHRTGKEHASTFWSGCGAIRREVFSIYGGFDESYTRPAVEDIELGLRISRDGRRISLNPQIQVTHRKRWSFWNVLRTDIRDRGVPWTELIFRERRMPNDLNLQMTQRVSVALAFALMCSVVAGAVWYGGLFLVPLMGILFFLLGHYWVDAPGKRVALSMSVVLWLTVALAWWNNMTALAPALVTSYVLLIVRHKFFYSNLRRQRMSGIVYGLFVVCAVLFTLRFLPAHPIIYAVYILVLAIAALNFRFYAFLGTTWGWLYTLSAIPLHFLHHLCNGVSFVIGIGSYAWKALTAPSAVRSSSIEPGK